MDKLAYKNSMVPKVFRATLIAFILSAVLLLIITLLMTKLHFSSGVLSVLVIVAYILSNFVGGFLIGKSAEKRRFLWGLLVGAMYFCILFILSFIITDAKDFSTMTAVRTMVICLFSGMLGGMVS